MTSLEHIDLRHSPVIPAPTAADLTLKNFWRHTVKEGRPASSLSHLLARHQVSATPRQVNCIFVEKKILMPMYRPSLRHPDALVKMLVLTGKGLEFGENSASPVHPIHTTPRYYFHCFEALMAHCGLPYTAVNQGVTELKARTTDACGL